MREALLLAGLTCLGVWSASAAEAPKWEPIGISGGGAMFSPAISPADPKLMMINCDMSAAYVSTDGGLNWKMIHKSQLGSNTQCRPAFHPTDPKVIYAAEWRQVKVSTDRGEHWQKLGELPGPGRGEIAIDPANPDLMLVGVGDGVCASHDGGKKWKKCEGLSGAALAFHSDQTSPPEARVCFAGTDAGVWRSDDGGRTWAAKVSGLPAGKLFAFAGGSNAKEKLVMLYATVPSKADGGKFSGGPYRSRDRGETWESALGTGLNVETKRFDQWSTSDIPQYRQIATSNAKPRTVYAFNTNTGIPPPHHASCYRSDDAGQTWRATFQGDPRYAGMNVEKDYTVCTVRQFYQECPLGLAANPANADQLLTTDSGRAYLTNDGGATWLPGHTRAAPGQDLKAKETHWLCNGLVVTTTWNYYLDPHDPSRHYICYTDIGFAHSADGGKTWAWWAEGGRAPWGNTCYELAFDPQTPGKVWGAFSDVHDIPNGNIIWGGHRDQGGGGVCVSLDHAVTWKTSNQGLPVAPCTSVVLDPKSPAGKRVLYAGIFHHGVFKSEDDGLSWRPKNTGLGADSNRRVCRVYLHPDGTLFALITALTKGRQFQPEGVGLYRSKDGGESWECINKSQPLLWPKDFTVDPKDSQIVYLGAANSRDKQDAGLYRTTDGGASWRRLAREGSEHFGAFLHPKRPGWIYMTLCEGPPAAGLWLSQDNGATWKPMNGLPFGNAQRVTFDPKDDNVIYVTTFGGSVWRGPAAE